MESAALPPGTTQAQLLKLAASKLGTLHPDGTINIVQTARALGYSERRLRRLLGRDRTAGATLHWNEAWNLLDLLGWLNAPSPRQAEAQLEVLNGGGESADGHPTRVEDALETLLEGQQEILACLAKLEEKLDEQGSRQPIRRAR